MEKVKSDQNIFSQKKALIVEDNNDLRRLMALQLEGAGWSVTEALDGESAIQLAKSDTPNIVFVDYRLPDMFGPEVVRRMRLNSVNGTSYVAVTGMDPADIQEESDCAGINYIAQKPVSSKEFKHILDTFGTH